MRKNNMMNMRKYLFICLMAMAAMGLTSCDNGRDCTCKPCQFRQETLDLMVLQKDWQFDNQAQMYFYRFDVPELTAEIYNYGEVSINREYNNGTQNAYQVALPETTYKQETSGSDTFFYQQHVDYAYGIGFVEIAVTISDFFYDDFTPENMIFRMQMTY